MSLVGAGDGELGAVQQRRNLNLEKTWPVQREEGPGKWHLDIDSTEFYSVLCGDLNGKEV